MAVIPSITGIIISIRIRSYCFRPNISSAYFPIGSHIDLLHLLIQTQQYNLLVNYIVLHQQDSGISFRAIPVLLGLFFPAPKDRRFFGGILGKVQEERNAMASGPVIAFATESVHFHFPAAGYRHWPGWIPFEHPPASDHQIGFTS